jgi:hypothetical protein
LCNTGIVFILSNFDHENPDENLEENLEESDYSFSEEKKIAIAKNVLFHMRNSGFSCEISRDIFLKKSRFEKFKKENVPFRSESKHQNRKEHEENQVDLEENYDSIYDCVDIVK